MDYSYFIISAQRVESIVISNTYQLDKHNISRIFIFLHFSFHE